MCVRVCAVIRKTTWFGYDRRVRQKYCRKKGKEEEILATKVSGKVENGR